MRLSIAQREAVITLRNQGHTTAQIKKHLERFHNAFVARSTIQRTVSRAAITGSVRDVPGKGRPSVCTERDVRAVLRHARQHRFDSIPTIASVISNSCHKNISPSTVRRVLRRGGVRRYIAMRKPALNARQRRARLAFAHAHSNWTVSQWRKILFTDEKLFKIFSNRRGFFVSRNRSEKYHPDCLLGTTKSGPQVHVWGAIGWYGCAPLKKVPASLNAVRYQQLIINDIEKVGKRYSARLWNRHVNWELMQDNAPAHRARTTSTFLAAKGVSVLDWPGNSPDLNPIENVWGYVQSRIPRTPMRNAEHLWEHVQAAWSRVPRSYIQKLFLSMPSRIQCVIAGKGYPTRY